MKSQSAAKSGVSREDVDQLVSRFIADLGCQEASPKTRASYRLDLLHFVGWFGQTVGIASVLRPSPRPTSASTAATCSMWSTASPRR